MEIEKFRTERTGTLVKIDENLVLKEVVTREEMADCYSIRTDVFILGQNVPVRDEIDGRDNEADHFLLLVNGKPVGTLRVLIEEGKYIHIGRVAVLQEERGKGYGRKMMEGVLGLYHREYPSYVFKIEAQVHARAFYEKLGFMCKDGKTFLDAGIEHVMMFK